jgi:hypothetical protein
MPAQFEGVGLARLTEDFGLQSAAGSNAANLSGLQGNTYTSNSGLLRKAVTKNTDPGQGRALEWKPSWCPNPLAMA